MSEYAFDIKMRAAVRVTANSEQEARKIMRETLDCATATFENLNGETIRGEASKFGVGRLYEVDGKEI